MTASPARRTDDLRPPVMTAANDPTLWVEAVERVRHLVHDLRNPVGSVGMAVELLRGPMMRALEQVDPVTRGKVASVLEALDESAEQLRHVVRGLDTVAPPDPWEPDIQAQLVVVPDLPPPAPQVTDVDELLRRVEILTVTRSPIPALLAVDAERGLRVPGAMGELARALCNLVANAVEATAASDVGEGPYTVWVKARRAADEVRMEVRDTGAGLPKVVRDYLAAPPGQGPSPASTKKDSGFHGVGLAAARRIIEEAGGTLSAARAQNQTVLKIVLPLAPL